MQTLKRILESPYLHLAIGLFMLVASLSEAWETLAEDLKSANLGAHHGTGLFGCAYALKALVDVLENLTKTSEAIEDVEEEIEKEEEEEG